MEFTNQAMQMLETVKIPALAVLVVAGIATGGFGAKIYRFWVIAGGVAAEIIGGEWILKSAEFPEGIMLAAGVVLAVVFGIIAFKSYVAGIFLFCLETVCAICISIAGMDSLPALIIGAGLGVIVGMVGLKFAEPVSIITTALFGGLMTARAGMELLHVESPIWIGILWIVLAAAGMAVQFIIEGRKKSRQDVRTAEDIKAKVSVENDVEAARTMILDLEDGQKRGSADTEEKTGAN